MATPVLLGEGELWVVVEGLLLLLLFASLEEGETEIVVVVYG